MTFLSDLIKPTETLFDRHNGNIVCVTRVDDRYNIVYAKYCTGPYAKTDNEYAFRPAHDLSYQPINHGD